MIEVSDFHKIYEETVAVRDLSFQVAAGEIMGLIGPNGAGKTTTLRTLCGIIPSSGGQITVAARDIDREAVAAKACTAYIPDDPQLFRDLSVAQHLAFTASVYNVADADAKADRLLKKFRLSSRIDTPAGDLSRGMRQKLAICCAYLHDPRVLLFDEPLTGLDPAGIRSLKQSILDRAAGGAAVIVSSHLLAMVEDICSHVLVLTEGRRRFWGPIENLRDEYAEGSHSSLEEIFFQATSEAGDTTADCSESAAADTDATVPDAPDAPDADTPRHACTTGS